MTASPPHEEHEGSALDHLTERELIAASGDPLGLLVEKLAAILTDEQWASVEPFVENALARHHELLSASDTAA